MHMHMVRVTKTRIGAKLKTRKGPGRTPPGTLPEAV